MSNQALAANLAKYRTIDYGNGFLTVRGDQEVDRRRARLARRVAAGAVLATSRATPGATRRRSRRSARAAKLAIQHGYQLCVHAIGDRANRETLDIFEEAFKANPDKKDLRWRVEHAQHLHPSDIPRFGQLGVIASMQGIHCTSDAPYVPARLGDKRAEEGAYVWQKLMKSGAVVTNGTDAPVEDVEPDRELLRDGEPQDEGRQRSSIPDQRMSRMEALKSYTINAAYAAFEENSKGSLKPGKYADMVVLSKDIMTVPEDRDSDARRSLYTIVGGKVRYKK